MGSNLPRLISDKYFHFFTPWQACLLTGAFSIFLGIFRILRSIARMEDEKNSLIFFLLFITCLESIIFIIVSILLIIGVYKKNKNYFLPWMAIACLDIALALTLSFVEISIPYRNNGSPCIVSLAGLLFTLAICALLIYCFIAIYHQYCLFDKDINNLSNRKVTPSSITISETVQTKSGTIEKGVKFNTKDDD